MGNITALAPPVRSGSYLAPPQPAGQALLQSLIASIEGLRSDLAVRSAQPPVRYEPAEPGPAEMPAAVEVRQVPAPKPKTHRPTVTRNRLLDFFD